MKTEIRHRPVADLPLKEALYVRAETMDVTALDGPFTPERTAGAARLVAEAIRYLNHATAEASGTGHAADVWEVLGSLGVAVGRMRQTLDHMGRSGA